MLSNLLAPEYILEIGTFTGYASLCLAEGLVAGGQLHTIEINEELRPIQQKYFARSKRGKQIVSHTGDAVEIIPKLDPQFDLVFIDGKKADYMDYWKVVLPKTRKGGVILCDNVLWSGKVARTTVKGDAATATLKEFNRHLKESTGVEVVILPVRDGLSMCRVL